jgi:RHS repeat-associated protein
MLAVQERDALNNPVLTYTRGNDLSGTLALAGGIGGLLARSENGQMVFGNPAAHSYYHSDGNGNITCLANSSGAVLARYSYDPFGNQLGIGGPLAEANSFRFSSKERHANSGLYYYGFRFYDPSSQGWGHRDPLREGGFETLRRHKAPSFRLTAVRVDGPNLYAFVGNNSVNGVDPWGLRDLCRAGKPLLGTGLDPKDSPPLGSGLDYAMGAAIGLGLVGLIPEALGAVDALAGRLAFAAAAKAYEAQVAATAAAAAVAARANQTLNFMNEYSKGYEQAEAAVEAAERTLEREQEKLQLLLQELNKAAQTLNCLEK